MLYTHNWVCLNKVEGDRVDTWSHSHHVWRRPTYRGRLYRRNWVLLPNWLQSWALSVYFWIFLIIKNDFLHFFYQVNSLFLHQSYLKSPLPVKLIKNAKNNFLLMNKLKNTESAQLWANWTRGDSVAFEFPSSAGLAGTFNAHLQPG